MFVDISMKTFFRDEDFTIAPTSSFWNMNSNTLSIIDTSKTISNSLQWNHDSIYMISKCNIVKIYIL